MGLPLNSASNLSFTSLVPAGLKCHSQAKVKVTSVEDAPATSVVEAIWVANQFGFIVIDVKVRCKCSIGEVGREMPHVPRNLEDTRKGKKGGARLPLLEVRLRGQRKNG